MTAFRIVATVPGSEARAGELVTPHGTVRTPAFVAVATRGTVKALGVDDLERLGVEVLIGNTYHLALRPGAERVTALGGLHGFSGWRGPWFTDSGGSRCSRSGQGRSTGWGRSRPCSPATPPETRGGKPRPPG